MGGRLSKERIAMGEEAWAEHVKQLDREKAKRYRMGQHVVSWHRRSKQKLIEYKGGKCERCGYDKKCPAVYHFHHKDPARKEFNISGKTSALAKLKIEADKCSLLCANCHAEIHEEEYEQIRESERKLFESRQNILCSIKNCAKCNTEFKQKQNKQKYCSEACRKHARLKVKDRPSKVELEELIKTSSWSDIGRKFNITDNSVKKWARKYGIEIPVRKSPILNKSCKICQNLFKPEVKTQTFCSRKCQGVGNRKFVRPPIEELREMRKTMTAKEMSEKLNVKECTLQGWFKYNP